MRGSEPPVSPNDETRGSLDDSGADEKRGRNGQAESIDHQLERGRLLDRHLGRAGARHNLAHIIGSPLPHLQPGSAP